ncbi:hypothetical protein VTO73DRAFT_9910 [Trametes versicolor]
MIQWLFDVQSAPLPAFNTFAQFALWMSTTEEPIDLRQALADMHGILVRGDVSPKSDPLFELFFEARLELHDPYWAHQFMDVYTKATRSTLIFPYLHRLHDHDLVIQDKQADLDALTQPHLRRRAQAILDRAIHDRNEWADEAIRVVDQAFAAMSYSKYRRWGDEDLDTYPNPVYHVARWLRDSPLPAPPMVSLHQSISPDERDADERDADEPDADEPDADEPDADEPDADERDADERDADERDADERDADERDADERDAEDNPHPDRSEQSIALNTFDAPDRFCDMNHVDLCDSPERSPPCKTQHGKTLPASLSPLEASSRVPNGADMSLAGKLSQLPPSVQHLPSAPRYQSTPIEATTSSRKRARSSLSSIETPLATRHSQPSQRTGGDVLSPLRPPRKKPALAPSSASPASRDNAAPQEPTGSLSFSPPQSLGDLLATRYFLRTILEDTQSEIPRLQRKLIIIQSAMQALHGLAADSASLASHSTYASILVPSPNRQHPHPLSTQPPHSVNDTAIAAPNGEAPTARRQTRQSTNAVAGPSNLLR